jgi:hypothetical protein
MRVVHIAVHHSSLPALAVAQARALLQAIAAHQLQVRMRVTAAAHQAQAPVIAARVTAAAAATHQAQAPVTAARLITAPQHFRVAHQKQACKLS